MPTYQKTPPALPAPDQLVSVKDVGTITGSCRSWIHEQTSANRFPKPIRLGSRFTRWRVSEVYAWMADPDGWIAARSAGGQQ